MPERDDAALARGRAELAAAGVDAITVDAAALSALAGRSPELDLALVERLAGAPSAEHAAALAQIASGAEGRSWKAVAKASRRALYRFAQRGIATPEPTPSVPAPSITRRLAAPALEALLSPVDGRGDRLVWLMRPQREGGLLVLTAVLNEPAGLRDVAIAELSRKTLRRMERDLETRHGLRMVAADAAYADALVAEGFARARVAGTQGVGEYPTYRARLTAAGPESREPPLIARIVDLAATPLHDAARRGPALLDEREFASWHLERDTIAPFVREIEAARESPLLLSRPQQEERVRGVVSRALRELFGGESVDAYRRRLEEMAHYLHATGRRDLALVAAGTAAALGASTRGGEGIPFFEELARRSFGVVLAEDAERAKADAESSVLVRPGAAAQRGAPPRAAPPRGRR